MTTEPKERPHTLSVLACNEPRILARVVGLFTARGYNITSLSVGEAVVTEMEDRGPLAGITIITTCDDGMAEQIVAQMTKMIAVIWVINYAWSTTLQA